ncbi:hypothetical protein [Budvicia aquatica]|uniref:Uncharacterized protein n=1 Tax=Budvicia aquatica TaxID=82979 RepID=A0A484ZEQ6_9GAMM|nr:hypothetical protein [Budvicia aquatica]VFS46844.1 Uncharacterised protein [Budvicia aquatica]VFS52088.1 Uncharacterised protein [Budvicia aquatica]
MLFIAAIFLVAIVIVLHKSKVGGVVIIMMIKILAPVLGFGAVAGLTSALATPFVGIPLGLFTAIGIIMMMSKSTRR